MMFGRLLLIGAATLAAVAVVSAMSFARDDEKKPEVVASVDLDKYAGKWYEIARLPNRFQEKCAGDVTATYTVRDGGGLKVLNECRGKDGELKKAEGRARLADEDGPNSKLEVRFAPSWLSWLPFVWGDYWILELAPDYSHALVGSPDRDYLWVLAREPRLDEEVYEQLVGRARAKGYDVSRLERTSHTQ